MAVDMNVVGVFRGGEPHGVHVERSRSAAHRRGLALGINNVAADREAR